MNKIHNRTDWKPVVSRYGLEVRAKLYAQIRDFFVSHSAFEVDTPVIQGFAVTDPNIECIQVHNLDEKYYLHSSPEYAMKRMLAFFKQDIYQICKVFRAGEDGKNHHSEFTMLEWYRVGWNYEKLMHETEELIRYLSKDYLELGKTVYTTYQNIFITYCKLDPFIAEQSDYIKACQRADISLQVKLSNKEYQELLLDQAIASQLPTNQLTFIYEFPLQQAALAKINESGVAERFELYLGDVELANGFQELTDAAEQMDRFQKENTIRNQNGKGEIKIDTNFVTSLKAGLPECAGVALGLDRLLMILMGVDNIKEVLTFPNY